MWMYKKDIELATQDLKYGQQERKSLSKVDGRTKFELH